MKRAAAFLTVGLLLEAGATVWTLVQAAATGVFEAPDCGVRTLALYHNERLPPNCERMDSSVVWFDEDRTPDAVFTSCTGALDDPSIEQQACDCGLFDQVESGCRWTSASSTREEIAGLCLAVPVDVVTAENKEEWGTTYDFVLDSSELEFQKPCSSLNPQGFGDIVIALVAVALALELLEAYVGYRRWKDPLSARGLVVIAAAAEGAGILSIWFLLSFSPSGIQEDEVTDKQRGILNAFMIVIFGATLAGTLAEVKYYCSGGASPSRLPYLGAVGSALIWVGSALIEVVVTAYLLWRIEYRNQFPISEEDLLLDSAVSQWEIDAKNQAADETTWPVLKDAAQGLIVLEALGLLVMWIARALFARAKATLLRAKTPPGGQEAGGVGSSGGSGSAGSRGKI